MPREITEHKVNECNEKLKIEVLDEPGDGGACHVYRICLCEPQHEDIELCALGFQNGPIKEVGTNGITQEALIAILIDRLEHFEAGPYACEENHQALDCLRETAFQLKKRTQRRVEAGVEGTHAGT